MFLTVQGGNGSFERDDVTDNVRVKGIVRDRRNVIQYNGIAVLRERRDVTDSARGRGSFGRDVILLTVQGGKGSFGRDLNLSDSAKWKVFGGERRDVTNNARGNG